VFAAELQYCVEHAIPHSEFLEWSDEDRAKVLAWTMEEPLRCQMCGTAEYEWEDNKFAYEPHAHVCRGCELKDLVMDDPDREHKPGEYIRLRKR
jgi:hypothetical protein